jgi:hypothetical protein
MSYKWVLGIVLSSRFSSVSSWYCADGSVVSWLIWELSTILRPRSYARCWTITWVCWVYSVQVLNCWSWCVFSWYVDQDILIFLLPMSIRILRFILGILGCIPFISWVFALMGLSDPMYTALHLPSDSLLDSNLRFYWGLWFTMGIYVLFTLRKVEYLFQTYAILYMMIFVWWVGRLISWYFSGLPPLPFPIFIGIEILGIPLLAYWHSLLIK